MSQVTMDVTFNKIILRVNSGDYDSYALAISPSVKNERIGEYEYPLSTQNLEKIYKVFDGIAFPRPVVRSGDRFIQEQRDKWRSYNNAKSQLRDIMKLEQYPLEPNGKFIPYKHQTKIVGSMLVDPYLPVGADCFLPGTRVKADGVYKPIEDIYVGQSIETLCGNASVFAIMNRKYNGEVVEIETSSGFFPVLVTDGHHFPTLKKDRCVIPSRANTYCSTLCDRNCPVKGQEPYKKYSIQKTMAKDLTTDHCLLIKQDGIAEDSKLYSDDLLTVVGYWLAEGHVGYDTRRGTKARRLTFSFGLDEKHTLVQDCFYKLQSLGLNPNIETHMEFRNVSAISVSDHNFAFNMVASCGEISNKKHLPLWFKDLSYRQKVVLLTAYFKGDGHYKNNYILGGRDSENIRVVTVSYRMASEVRDELLKMGIRCSAIRENAKTDKDGVSHKECYRILIPRRFTGIFGFQVDKVRRDLKQLTHSENEFNYTLIPIRTIEKSLYSGVVYNLTSSGHDSYLTDIGTSHNCGTGKTGSTERAIEILLNQGVVSRGKVLVSAPLSILQTSWADDAEKFTNLKVKILWTPVANKTIKTSELKQVSKWSNNDAPDGALTKKKKKGMRWLRSDGFVKQMRELDPFDDADAKTMGLSWSKVEATWMEATMMNGDVVPYGPIWAQGVAKESTRKNLLEEMLQDPTVDVFLINHDGVRIYEELLKQHKFEWVIVDESTKIKSMKSKVTKAHIDISWNATRRTTLSGTPNPNGFLDLWSQYYFLDRGMTLNTKLKDFQQDYFTPVKIGHFGGQDAVKWELRDPKARDALVEKVKGTSIFLKQRDCVDLPPRTDMTREIIMTPAQSKAYLQMEKDLVSDFLDNKTKQNIRVEAVNTLSKLMKLRQMTSGFVGHSDGIASLDEIANNPKFLEMDDLIEELGDNKLVIACQFKEEIYSLLARYKHLGISAIYGDAKLSDRVADINRFQKTNELQIMLLQPQAAAHGITLTEAHYFVFLSLDYNFEYYYQVGKRIERIGQRFPMFMYHFLAKTENGGDTIDHDLMDVLRSKSQDRDILFNNDSDIVDIANTLKTKIIQRVQQG